MEYSPILVPVVALVAWTLVVMAWMVLTRIPAMKKGGHHAWHFTTGRARREP